MPDDLERARQLINKHTNADGMHVEPLCDELSRIVMQLTYTVFEVFNVLTEKQFNQAAHEQVAIELIRRINRANLIQLAQSRHGWILLERIYNIMNCEANNGQQTCQYILAAVVRAKEIERAKTPRQISPEEMNWYANYNQTKSIFYERDGNGVLRSSGGKRNNFDSNICWELPKEGVGFTTFNRDDLKSVAALKDERGFDQIGTKETIEAMTQIAKEWNALHSDRLLQYGDISRPGGVNTPDHKTHDNGKAFDIRLLRKDSKVGIGAGFSYTQKGIYDQALTKEFILLVRRLYPGTKFLFNDPQLDILDPDTRDFVTKSTPVHDNHLHVIFPGGN